jgi:hypothetical protein
MFAAGDASGLCRPETAALEGRLAGMLAAARVGKGSGSEADASRRDASGSLGDRVAAARRDDAAAMSAWLGVMWHLEERCVREALGRADTHLCRCELVSGPVVGASIDDIAVTPADVKRATRVGMGECQGQHCRSLIARAVAIRTGRPPGLDHAMSYRPPVRPITIGQLIAGDP